MRIGEFAKAARTTTRTVRYYHQLGLLPEPVRRANGYREYELADLIRLLRITWLAGAGVPLAKVGELLTDDDMGFDQRERDLELVAQVMTAERDRIDRQLEALARIRTALDEGRSLSALPVELADAIDRVEAAADDQSKDVVRRDREMLEILAMSGELPSELATAYVALTTDPDQLHQALRIAAAFAAVEGKPVREVGAAIDGVVELLLGAPIVREMLVGAGDGSSPSPDEAAFYLPDAAQREIVVRLLRRIR